MKKFLFVFWTAFFALDVSSAIAANQTDITTPYTSSVPIPADNYTVNISGSGNLLVNTNTTGKAAIYSNSTYQGTNINVTGTFSDDGNNNNDTGISAGGATAGALVFSNSSNLGTLNLNSGVIRSKIANSSTISLTGNGSTTINVGNSLGTNKAIIETSGANSATIIAESSLADLTMTIYANGKIKGDVLNRTSLTLTNNGTIDGNLKVGTDGNGSIITLNNGSVITRNVQLNNFSQTVRLFGGKVNGDINGAGNITVFSDTVLAGTVGLSSRVNAINISNNATFDAATNNKSINAVSLTLHNGSIFNAGNGSLNSTNILTATDNQGTFNLNLANNSNYILRGNVGSSTRRIHEFNIVGTAGANRAALNGDIYANQISIDGNNMQAILASNKTITGLVTLNNNGLLTLNNGSAVVGNINGTGNNGFISIAASANVTLQGVVNNIRSVDISNQATLDAVNYLISADAIYLYSNANFKFGTAGVAADVVSAGGNNNGGVIVTGNSTITNKLGEQDSYGLATLTINPTVTLATNKQIYATNVNVGAGSTLTTSSTIARSYDSPIDTYGNGAITLGSGSTLALGNGAKVFNDINGSSSGFGNITTSGTTSLNAIGATNSINNITINSGSHTTFGGSINASGNVNVSGEAIFAAPATITAGNFNLNSGGKLNLTISNPALTLLNVNGAASVSANSLLLLQISGSIALNTSITLISATSPSSLNAISAGNININGTSSNIYGGNRFVTSVLGNDLLLTALAPEGRKFSNDNDQNTYDAIDKANSSGALAMIKSYVNDDSNSLASKEAVLKSVQPQADNSSNRVSFNNLVSSADIISARLDSIRNANSPAHNFGAMFNSINKKSFQGVSALQNNNDFKNFTPFSMSFGDESEKSRAAWVQTFGSITSQDNVKDISGYRASSGGIAVGVDCKTCQDFILGVSAGYSQTNIDSKDHYKNLQIKTYQANIYTSHNFDPFFLNTTLGFALNDYSSRRQLTVTNATAKASYLGESYIARAEAGRKFAFKKDIFLMPTLTVTAAHNNIGSYSENGADTLNLHVKNQSANFLEARAGVELSRLYTLKKKFQLRPQIGASYGYDFIGDKQKSTSNFIGQTTTFETVGSKVAQGSLKLSGGLAVYNLRGATLSANYNYEQRIDYKSHSGWLVARYGF